MNSKSNALVVPPEIARIVKRPKLVITESMPLCRNHHRALHRSGSEYLWWENVGIDPLKVARKLWKRTRRQHERSIAKTAPAQALGRPVLAMHRVHCRP